jgi:hypothetical protein
MAHKIIEQLVSVSGLKIECPRCNDVFPIRKAQLHSMYETYPPSAQKIIRGRQECANATAAMMYIAKIIIGLTPSGESRRKAVCGSRY